jgi:hypothetical protein
MFLPLPHFPYFVVWSHSGLREYLGGGLSHLAYVTITYQLVTLLHLP